LSGGQFCITFFGEKDWNARYSYKLFLKEISSKGQQPEFSIGGFLEMSYSNGGVAAKGS